MYSPITKLCVVPALLVGVSAAPATFNTSHSLEARDKWAFTASTLGIRVFNSASCGGKHFLTYPAVYGHNNEPGPITSYQLSRSLQPGEKIDFSTYAPNLNDDDIDKACDLFIGKVLPGTTAGQDAGACLNLGTTANCFRLTMN